MRLTSDSGAGEEEAAPMPPTNGAIPTHLQGYAAAESQDSLDDYYDASGTLRRGRPHTGGSSSVSADCSGSIVRPRPMSRERRRHASSGSAATENGHAHNCTIENVAAQHILKDNYISSPCIASKGPIARVRHSSCCDAPGVSGLNSPGLHSKNSTPYHSAKLPLPILTNGAHGRVIANGSSVVANGTTAVPKDLSNSLVGDPVTDRWRFSNRYQLQGLSAGSAPSVVLDDGPGRHQRPSVVQSNGSVGSVALTDPRSHVNSPYVIGDASSTRKMRDRGSLTQADASDYTQQNGFHLGGSERSVQLERDCRADAISVIVNVADGAVNSSDLPSSANAGTSARLNTQVKLESVCGSGHNNRKGNIRLCRDDNPSRVQGNCSPIQYVPCVEIERDPAFKLSGATKDCDGSPSKGVNYTEFVLDKSGITDSSKPSSPQEFCGEGPSSRLEPAVHRRCEDLRDGSPRSPASKTSSCLSLNFAWRKSYVPFRGMVDEIPSGRVVSSPDGFVPSGCSEEPLLQGLSPCQADPPASGEDKEVTMYTFDKAGAGGTWSFREELALTNLRLTHPAPHLMVTAQWQQHNRMSCLYLGYRLFWALYFVMWSAWSLAGNMGYQAPWSLKVHYFTYLTNWSIWLLALDTSMQAANVLWHMCRMAEQGDARYPFTPKTFRLSWVLSNITFTVHLFITLAYWATVYPFRDDQTLTIIGVNTHMIPGLYVAADAFLSATPRRLLHGLHPMLYFLAYVMFNMLYYLLGGTDYLGRVAIYPFMDWSNPGQSLLVVSGVLLVLFPMLHLLHCGIYAVRVRMWRRYRLSRYVQEDGELERGTKFEEQIV